ncbi:ABC-type antimicrobial peptide transport system, ATPase component [Cryptobacterium curtum DSM 15641]|uniref:ABC-type antimicrobial peptide transport system, ATPase component n=1 Tax=Cryptobacterium curtum (strain ATCC 700683 / DSM 15641 / CCUG 43107 / 12-3) TaxID=469378 RepID=C7MLN4_CRYCD|nr:ABC transporter ATP-binding protein/permease [Cryptobacterium curtum]ACU93840.1 ABC-type antimicrobial peptide transport system, ATPase component [Cryptobacterium curtum DSM 15641]
MIELRELRKSYKTGDFVQKALDGVSLNLRNNEFVAVLGASGSGKTTLLNILGGLDHADSGDIVINGTSTKNYRAKDWDAYRNHRIGFIFQSYNLIPHQSILSNVELALTLAGVSRAERRRRATEALKQVGLGDHLHKRPNQLSGGQMQRVAIARALVNDPNIVLADEPTGALDTETGIQVMNILKDVASDRLVIMVTHNPELAEEYATRIVRLTDGRIAGDSNPFVPPVASALPRAAQAATGAAAVRAAAVDAAEAAETMSAESVEDNAGEVTSATSDQAGAPKDKMSAFVPVAGTAWSTGVSAAGSSAATSAGAGAGSGIGSDRKRNAGKASMSFLTALALSFNNLMTKKGRTFLTAFAGSIGIIGIASILSLSNGVNNYIADTEEKALMSYPLSITKSSFDIAGLMTVTMGYSTSSSDDVASEQTNGDATAVSTSTKIPEEKIMSDMFAKVKTNNLRAFKNFLDNGDSGIDQYLNAIQYNYSITPQVYLPNTENDEIKRINPSEMGGMFSNGLTGSALSVSSSGMNSFYELSDSSAVRDTQMELLEGHWPESANEAVLVLSGAGQISDYTLYSLGVYDPEEMTKMAKDALAGNEVTVPETSGDFTYEDALNLSFKIVPLSSMYQYNDESGTWTDMSKDDDYMKQRIDEGIDLRIVGVVKKAEGASGSSATEGVAYTSALTRELMNKAAESDIVKQQIDNPDTDVFTGKTFDELKDSQKEEFDLSSVFSVDEEALQKAFSFDSSALSQMGSGFDPSALSFDGSSLAFDPSSLQLDSSAISEIFNEDSMREIMANAPRFNLDSSSAGSITDGLSAEQRQQIAQASNSLAAGFLAWYVTPQANGGYGGSLSDLTGSSSNFAAAFQQYLATDGARAITDPLMQDLGGDIQQQINAAMQNYMTNQFAPYLSESLSALMQQAAQVMGLQMAQALQTQMAALTGTLGSQLSQAISGQLSGQINQLSEAMQNGFSFDPEAFADAIHFNMTQDDLTSLLTNYMNTGDLTYDGNMKKLGYAEEASPSSIDLYPVDFPAKEKVIGIIGDYNTDMTNAGEDDKVIQYSDLAGVLMKSVTDIVNTISLVLIAFVSISLVVSSIMIAIITYISVLERRKEIGILRAMGASKRNVGSVFNAETIIEGLIAGIFAIAAVWLASFPVNAFVEAGWNVPNIMSLPWESALILIGVSVALTFVAGLIPSSMASRRDPVEVLRSE